MRGWPGDRRQGVVIASREPSDAAMRRLQVIAAAAAANGCRMAATHFALQLRSEFCPRRSQDCRHARHGHDGKTGRHGCTHQDHGGPAAAGRAANTASPATNGFSRRRCATRSSCWRGPTGGPVLFFVPRFLPDGSVNALRVQRLKDKLGNRSNACSEVEFQDATAGSARKGAASHHHRNGDLHAA